jgi:osmoprotectant transport system substrate-binding protein
MARRGRRQAHDARPTRKDALDMTHCSARAAIPLALALLLAVALAACGSGGGATTAARSDAQPGRGRPPVTLGTKSLPQYLVIGRLYAQALEAEGFTVELKQSIGSVRAAARALHAGQIDAYPEPIGGLDAALAGAAGGSVPSLRAALGAGRAYARDHGLTLLAPTPFADADALAVLPTYAQQHRISSIADLARIRSLRLGARPEFRTHRAGLVGLRTAYGIAAVTYYPLTAGVQYGVLDDGHVDVAGVQTSDGQLARTPYRLLADPKGLFGVQNVTLMVRTPVLAAEGPAFQRTLDAVSRTLTTAAVQQLDAAVAVDRQRPEDVARDFLAAHGLG